MPLLQSSRPKEIWSGKCIPRHIQIYTRAERIEHGSNSNCHESYRSQEYLIQYLSYSSYNLLVHYRTVLITKGNSQNAYYGDKGLCPVLSEVSGKEQCKIRIFEPKRFKIRWCHFCFELYSQKVVLLQKI
jgi:hypothetical protein